LCRIYGNGVTMLSEDRRLARDTVPPTDETTNETRRNAPMALVPFDDRDGWIWYDGEFVAWRDAKLHVLSHGLHYASGVFEGSGPIPGTSSSCASTPSA
jgi:hypothetical protein